MEDYVSYAFLENLRKEDKKKEGKRALSITPIDFENYKVEKLGEGILSLSDLLALKEWTESTLKTKAHQIEFFVMYSQKSPRYWLKDITKKDEQGNYSISIDLERFIKSKSAEKYEKNGAAFFIPDNYELAKKVMSEFKKIHPNKEFKIIENHFRECANWESKNFLN